MADRDAVERRLLALFAERLVVAIPSPHTELLDAGLVDSLMLVELLAAIEQEFGIRIAAEDLEIDRFRSVARIAEFVATRSSATTRPPVSSGTRPPG